ncbi:MAG: hypothetical protein EXS38_03505 [Opitutus sp.]|nr:hypothetical protein [Opitutus sp.]
MNAIPAGLVFASLLFAGCGATLPLARETPALARIFLESADARGTDLALPQSGVHLVVNPQPVLVEGDFTNVELVQVELGKCLMFQLSPAAARDFYRLSASHQGRRLVLVVNGAPVGARRIDGPIADGVVYIFVELTDDVLPRLVDDLKKTTSTVQRAIARKS